MSYVLETTRMACRLYSDQLQRATRVLSDNFNIIGFYYQKTFSNGQFYLIENNADLVDHLEEQRFIEKYSLCCHPKFHRNEVQMRKNREDPLLNNLEVVRKCLLVLNFNLGIRFCFKTDDYVEEFGFHSVSCDDKQCMFLFNKMDELKIFINWFVNKNKKIICFLRESSVDLVKIIGDNFYTDRVNALDSSYALKTNLLSKFDVCPTVSFSQSDVDTILLLKRGFSPSQIATKHYRSERTIEHRIQRLRKDMSCGSTRELVEKARELEWRGLLLSQ